MNVQTHQGPLVSVLLPVYNEKETWLRLAIESILTQSIRDLELIIVTDGVIDNALIQIIQDAEKTDARVKVLYRSEWAGIAISLNAALQLAGGKYISRMDADDIADPLKLEKQIRFLEDNPQIACVGCQVEKIDERGESVGYSQSPLHPVVCRAMARFVNPVTHATIVMHRDEMLALQGYRTLISAEDYDLILRLLSSGKQMANMPACLLQYRIRSEGITQSTSHLQKICFRIVQDLYMRRVKGQDEMFSPAEIVHQISQFSTQRIQQQHKAQRHLAKYRRKELKGNVPLRLYHLLMSVLHSGLQRRYYLDWIQAAGIRIWYKIRYGLS